MTSEMVEPGQVWQRVGAKTHLRVLWLSRDGKARVQPVDRAVVTGEWVPDVNGAHSSIRVDRFRPTANGYRLVASAPARSP